MRRRGGFTLIEVMVTVMVLALVTTAALKLVIMAQNTLSAVKDKEDLLNAAQAVEAGISTKELPDSGTSGDLKWETKRRKCSAKILDASTLTKEPPAIPARLCG